MPSFAKRKEYWNFKYNQLKPDIEKGQENGTNFYYCWLCGYKSRKIKSIEVDPLLVYGSCLVCEDTKLELLVPCMKHDCEGHILSPDIYSGICSTCESQIEDDNPIEKLISELDNIFAVCTECDWLGEGTVIGYGIESEEKYVCLNCLTEYHADSLEQCPYCGRWFAGGVNELGICYECHDVTLANFGE